MWIDMSVAFGFKFQVIRTLAWELQRTLQNGNNKMDMERRSEWLSWWLIFAGRSKFQSVRPMTRKPKAAAAFMKNHAMPNAACILFSMSTATVSGPRSMQANNHRIMGLKCWKTSSPVHCRWRTCRLLWRPARYNGTFHTGCRSGRSHLPGSACHRF